MSFNINKEIAYLAKQKGYNTSHDKCYSNDAIGSTKTFIILGHDINNFAYIVTQDEICEWVRINHGYHIYSIPKFNFGQMMGYSIRVYLLSDDKKRGEKIIDDKLFTTYEDALMFGIKKVLNKLKDDK